jgi:hypothetical protein
VLEKALRHIIANNGAPGVDGNSVSQFKESAELREKFLHDLQAELKANAYFYIVKLCSRSICQIIEARLSGPRMVLAWRLRLTLRQDTPAF